MSILISYLADCSHKWKASCAKNLSNISRISRSRFVLDYVRKKPLTKLKKSERSERGPITPSIRAFYHVSRAKERAALWNSRCERGAIELIGAAYTRRTDNIMHCSLRSQHDRELISKIINWTYSGSRLASGFKGKLGLIKRSAYERADQPDRQRAHGKRTTSCVPLVKIRYQ